MSYTFDPTILREYDIRGQIGKNLSEDDAYALGRAFGTFIQTKDVIGDSIQITRIAEAIEEAVETAIPKSKKLLTAA